jgi:hypothetical protein
MSQFVIATGTAQRGIRYERPATGDGRLSGTGLGSGGVVRAAWPFLVKTGISATVTQLQQHSGSPSGFVS